MGLRNDNGRGMAARGMSAIAVLAGLSLLAACGEKSEPLRQPKAPTHLAIAVTPIEPAVASRAVEAVSVEQAMAVFGTLPSEVKRGDQALTEPLVALGRQLFYDTRLSKNHDLSCNSCHQLSSYGIDPREESGKTSSGHKGAFGDRNSPTVYNAALHIAQFWDGRAKDVEEQAKGPVLNPVEMAMPGPRFVVRTLRTIPGYKAMFVAAFPNSRQPISYDNMARAIGAFERRLLTPAPFDAWLGGDETALTPQQKRGLKAFLDTGCAACHAGPGIGGQMYQKLGLLKEYPVEDIGRAKITGNEAENFFFKVPSLRNVEKTAPYLHDGSVSTLPEMVRIMAAYQTPKGKLSDAEVADIVAFLKSLTGQLPTAYIAEPEPLPSGPRTPKPDPS